MHFRVTLLWAAYIIPNIPRILKHGIIAGSLDQASLLTHIIMRYIHIASHAKPPFICRLYVRAADLNSLISGIQKLKTMSSIPL